MVWVNGPFGGGKTQVAHELRRRAPGSVICDPEQVGYGLQRMTPPALREDFQDLTSWRAGVLEVLRRTLGQVPGPVIVPMTLVEPSYFEEIVQTLRAERPGVRHVALLADREVVLARLGERVVGRRLQGLAPRGWAPRREAFAVAHLDRCLDRLQAPLFAEQVWTDRLSVPEVADRVASAVGLPLLPNRNGPTRQRLLQTWTQLRHLRPR